MMDARLFFRKYSEIYTVFLPLFAVFLVIYTIMINFSPSHPYIPDDDSDILLYLHRSLVSIPSVTTNEHATAQFLKTYLTSKGWTVEIQPVSNKPVRDNVFAYRGSERSTRVLFSSHIDTVPPFIQYSVHDGYIWGRGSVDAKASVAAQITAAQELLSSNAVAREGDVSLLFVVGEETDGIGMITANDLGLSWETVIFGEPTELKLAVGHKGLILADVYATGKASHSGYPDLGINANYYLVEALYKLQNLDYPYSDLLGNTTFNAGTLAGGVAANVIPAAASAGLAVRVAEDLDGAVSQMQRAVLPVPNVDINITLAYPPVLCDYDVSGFDTVAVAYGTDIPHLQGSHKRYLYGPGSILFAHADDERISEDELRESVVGYKKLAAAALGETHDMASEGKNMVSQ
ncbi:hypothetical protein POJ06DRAFT_55390 [Lipomyces tetrasporus]|uniref:Peptidase M20 dimerisation domain-containing protein n=1 Tax=Lipomyces tetrasporus TaxID=54092 RepID=A0AAD7QWJ0_9ASCO|nr:uncharacterized protein POJ06DRAFT_55390 [Lipomyces tetrasporus]KAJ8102778.1 hypothetical protein POJ06DRAFT_55390 [Lipomyces tetrasporus]